MSIHFSADQDTVDTIYRIILSVNELSVYGAVAAICDEFEDHQDQPRESTGTTTIPLRERNWIDIEPSKQDLESYDLSKKVINLLRHNQKLHREEDGAIQFHKIKFHLRDHHSQIQNWSDDRWKACLAAGGGFKRRYQYCSDNFGINYLTPCSSRTFWEQSH